MSLEHSYKFGKNYHLKNKKEIDKIFKDGKKKIINNIIIFFNHSANFKYAVGFKKHKFKASQKNYIKRKIKEYLRLNKFLLKNFNCVIVVLKYPCCSFQSLYSDLNFLFYSKHDTIN
jgi:ribonuclease P protein component